MLGIELRTFPTYGRPVLFYQATFYLAWEDLSKGMVSSASTLPLALPAPLAQNTKSCR